MAKVEQTNGVFIANVSREEFFEALQNYKTSKETEKQSEELLTRQEACKKLNVSLCTIDNWVKAGLLTISKIGRRVLIKNSEVQRMIDKNQIRRAK